MPKSLVLLSVSFSSIIRPSSSMYMAMIAENKNLEPKWLNPLIFHLIPCHFSKLRGAYWENSNKYPGQNELLAADRPEHQVLAPFRPGPHPLPVTISFILKWNLKPTKLSKKKCASHLFAYCLFVALALRPKTAMSKRKIIRDFLLETIQNFSKNSFRINNLE